MIYKNFLEIVKAAPSRDTLHCRRMLLLAPTIALPLGKITSSPGLLDQNETRFFTYVLQHAENEAATVTKSD